VRAWAGFPPRHADCTLISLSERGAPAVGMSDGSQKSESFALSASACSRSIWRAAASSASRARVSMADASSSNLRFVPRPAMRQTPRRRWLQGGGKPSSGLPLVDRARLGPANPSCPRSNSASTRSRAAAFARACSSACSRLRASSRCFWRLMSFFCATAPREHDADGREEAEVRTEVGVHALGAEEMALGARQRCACALKAERACVEAAHRLVPEPLLHGGGSDTI
jgi:hypothetical protein